MEVDMGVLIAIEGICCSGKTTMTQLLAERLTLKGYNSIYNHGAMTYTPVGREFYEITANKNFGITTSFYLIDLIINIQTYIRPLIEKIQEMLCYRIDILIRLQHMRMHMEHIPERTVIYIGFRMFSLKLILL